MGRIRCGKVGVTNDLVRYKQAKRSPEIGIVEIDTNERKNAISLKSL